MLDIKRGEGEAIVLTIGGQTVRIKINRITRHAVRLGFDAPKSVEIWREELYAEVTERRRCDALQGRGEG